MVVTSLTRALSVQQFGLKDGSLIHHQAFINGQWVNAEDGKKFSVTSTYKTVSFMKRYLCETIDPSTAEELGQVADIGLDQTKEAINAASNAFKTWSKTTAKVRCGSFTPTGRV